MERVVRLKILRYSPSSNRDPYFQEYSVPYVEGQTVLDALIYIKSWIDHTVSMRYSCRMASCGSCGMKIEGIPRLACYTQISELKKDLIRVEPLDNLPIIKDLATDLTQFFDKHKQVIPYLIRKDSIEQEKPTTEYIQMPEEVERYLQFSYCIKCALCYSACPTVATDRQFPGPQALAQVYRYVADTRDDGLDQRMKRIDGAHGIWRCHYAGSCSMVCPKGVDPSLGIQLLRRYALPFFGRTRIKKVAPVFRRV